MSHISRGLKYAGNYNNTHDCQTACDSKKEIKINWGHARQSLPSKWPLLVKLSQFGLFDATEHKENKVSIILPRVPRSARIL